MASSYYAVNAETSGTQRGPSYTNLDLRLEKEFKISTFGRMNVYVDIFNLAGYFFFYDAQFMNYWSFEGNIAYNPAVIDLRSTRGG